MSNYMEQCKNKREYEFDCFLEKGYGDKECWDEWGVATVILNKDFGAEYNLCFDEGVNQSAIYPWFWDGEFYSTDTCYFQHYEVDFTQPDWEQKLYEAMVDVAECYMKLHVPM